MARISPDFSRSLLHTFRCTFQVRGSCRVNLSGNIDLLSPRSRHPTPRERCPRRSAIRPRSKTGNGCGIGETRCYRVRMERDPRTTHPGKVRVVGPGQNAENRITQRGARMRPFFICPFRECVCVCVCVCVCTRPGAVTGHTTICPMWTGMASPRQKISFLAPRASDRLQPFFFIFFSPPAPFCQ